LRSPGLIRAVETCFPRALRQRCLVHRLRNLRSKAPESQWPEIALRARGCYEAASLALAAVLRDDFVAAYERELPAVCSASTTTSTPASPTFASRSAIGA
jgi:transposase-like protein